MVTPVRDKEDYAFRRVTGGIDCFTSLPGCSPMLDDVPGPQWRSRFSAMHVEIANVM